MEIALLIALGALFVTAAVVRNALRSRAWRDPERFDLLDLDAVGSEPEEMFDEAHATDQLVLHGARLELGVIETFSYQTSEGPHVKALVMRAGYVRLRGRFASLEELDADLARLVRHFRRDLTTFTSNELAAQLPDAPDEALQATRAVALRLVCVARALSTPREAFVTWLTSPGPDLETRAGWAIRWLGTEPRVRELAARVARTEGPAERRVEAALLLDDPQLLEAVVNLDGLTEPRRDEVLRARTRHPATNAWLNHLDELVTERRCTTALTRACAALPPREARPRLERLFARAGEFEWTPLLEALGCLDAGVSCAWAALTSELGEVQRAARTLLLAQLEPAELDAGLAARLAPDDPARFAACTLARHGSVALVPALRALADRGEEPVATEALNAISAIQSHVTGEAGGLALTDATAQGGLALTDAGHASVNRTTAG